MTPTRQSGGTRILPHPARKLVNMPQASLASQARMHYQPDLDAFQYHISQREKNSWHHGAN